MQSCSFEIPDNAIYPYFKHIFNEFKIIIIIIMMMMMMILKNLKIQHPKQLMHHQHCYYNHDHPSLSKHEGKTQFFQHKRKMKTEKQTSYIF